MQINQNGFKQNSFVHDIITLLVEQKAILADEAPAIIKGFSASQEYEFDAFLVDTGIVTPAQLLTALEKYYTVPAFDVVGHFFESAYLHKFPKQFLLFYGVIPLEDDENTLVLVASDPHNTDLLLEIGKYVSYDVQFKVGLYQDIIDAIKEFYDPSLTEDVMQEMYDEPPDMLMAERSEFEQLDEAGGFFIDQEQDE